MFCMLITHFDESYNDKTITVGAGLRLPRVNLVERDWLTRIEYENRKSRGVGESLLTRYKSRLF
jgi:hypothetical protein